MLAPSTTILAVSDSSEAEQEAENQTVEPADPARADTQLMHPEELEDAQRPHDEHADQEAMVPSVVCSCLLLHATPRTHFKMKTYGKVVQKWLPREWL